MGRVHHTPEGLVEIVTLRGDLLIGLRSARAIVRLGPLHERPVRSWRVRDRLWIAQELRGHREALHHLQDLLYRAHIGGIGFHLNDEDAIRVVADCIYNEILVALLVPRARVSDRLSISTSTAPPPPVPSAAVARPPTPATPPQNVPEWSTVEKLKAALSRSINSPRLGNDLRAALLALLTPEALAEFAIIMAGLVAAQAAGVGEIADAALAAYAYYQAGFAGLRAVADFIGALVAAARATSEADLDHAADRFAQDLVVLGVAFLSVSLMRASHTRGSPALSGESSAGSDAAGGTARRAVGRGAAAESRAGAQSAEGPAAAEEVPAEKPPESGSSRPSGEEDCKTCKGEGEPVNPATGSVYSVHVDFTLPGLVPLIFERTWTSTSTMNGELGHGWHHALDMAVTGRADGKGWSLRLADGRLASFDAPTAGHPSIDLTEKMQLWTDGGRLWATDYSGVRYDFSGRCPDGQRRLIGIRDANGNGIALGRDADGHLHSIIAGGGRRLTVVRDGANRITRIDGPAPDGDGQAPLIVYSYDAAGDLVTAAAASGAGFRYNYTNHLLAQITWPAAAKFDFHYDDSAKGTAARCVETVGETGLFRRQFVYDLGARTTTVSDGRGATRLYECNAQGRVTALTDGLGRRTTYEFDANQRPMREVRPDGQERSWRYDAFGRTLGVTEFDGSRTAFSYPDPFPGQPLSEKPTSVTDPNGRSHHIAYDPRGNLVEHIDPAGRRRTWLRAENGLPLAVRDSLGPRRIYRWTADGRIEREATPRGLFIEYSYDRLGRLIATRRAGEQPTRFVRDAVGNVTEIVRSDGGRVQLAYDAEGQITMHRDAAGQETRWEYGGLSSPLRRLNPDGSRLEYKYDSDLNLIGLVNAKGEEYRLTYDLADQLVEEVGFDGRRQCYEYDAAGFLVAHADEEARGARYRRDAMGRLLERAFADGTADRYVYDPTGALIVADNANRRVAFAYGRGGELVQERQDDLILRHDYDERVRRIATTLPDGRRVTFGWGEDDRFTSLGFGGRNVATIARDVAGRETERRAGAVTVVSAYDPQGRLVRQSGVRGPTRERVLGRSYAYDAASRVEAIDDAFAGMRRYSYDSCDRLVGVAGDDPEDFVIDPAGNILASGGAEPGTAPGDRLAFFGDRKFEYDACGNRVRERRGAGGGVEVDYGYGPDNQLASVEERDRLARRVTEFTYDGLGRRVSKRHRRFGPTAVNDGGGSVDFESNVVFLWDGDRLLAEGPTPAAALATVYLHEPRTFRPIAAVRGATVCHYHLDHLGTPREVTNDNGKVVWQAALKAWGAVARVSVAAVDNPLRFQGQYHDAETGLHYNRFRYYSPEEGRFVHQDPIGLLGGTNNAAYVSNPTEWTDPYGLDPATSTHITYVGVDQVTGKPYVGYASMPGDQTGEAVLNYRYSNDFSRFGDTAPDVIYRGYGTDAKATARGLEQRTFEDFGGLDGTANAQNPVGERNANRQRYLDAADEHRKASQTSCK